MIFLLLFESSWVINKGSKGPDLVNMLKVSQI